MKKSKFLICAVMLISLFLPVSALADNRGDVVVSLQINNPIMELNGKKVEIDEGRDTKPIVKNGRTLVPIRAIIEAFGGSVGWEEETKSVLLTMEDDTIKLAINSSTAYLNGKKNSLDVAPTVVNGRTMLPIRFIAEGFNLAVAWDSDTQRVYVISNSFDENEYNYVSSAVPEYSGKAYAVVNNNEPMFKDYEIIDASFEYYGSLDELGRCDVCFASVAKDLMPTSEREAISSVKPTGWVSTTYDNVEGGYLYNRCHLIGYQLTGENANKRNLITGTRYLNIDGMLPFENEIADYVKKTGNRVLYRATPVFSGDNLVADGVLLEAYSIEDEGEEISFCVFCYNVQPEIKIDYKTGESRVDKTIQSVKEVKIYRTPKGKRYHFNELCGGLNSFETTLKEAEKAGLTPCEKCVQQ